MNLVAKDNRWLTLKEYMSIYQLENDQLYLAYYNSYEGVITVTYNASEQCFSGIDNSIDFKHVKYIACINIPEGS